MKERIHSRVNLIPSDGETSERSFGILSYQLLEIKEVLQTETGQGVTGGQFCSAYGNMVSSLEEVLLSKSLSSP